MLKLTAFAAASLAIFQAGAAYAFDACPTADSLTMASAEDGKSYSTIFNDFTVGGGEQGTCAYSFGLSNGAAPGTISVFSADYRGFVSLSGPDDASVSIAHNGTSDGETFSGPSDTDYTHSDIVATTDGKIASTATVDMRDASDPDNDLGTLDAADYTQIGQITLPTDESAIIAHLGASAGLLTSARPISEDNSVTLFGGIGSAMLGGNGQYNIGEGFSLLGGAAYVQQDYATVKTQGFIGALAVRYVQPGLSTFRPFAEGGATLGALGLTFTDPSKTTTSAGLGSVYARGGVEAAIDSQNSVALSATLEESFLGVDGYALANGPFSATIASQMGRFTVAKAEASFHSQLTETVDASASIGAGALIGHDKVNVAIAGLGTVSQTPPTQFFVDYGARIGWMATPTSKLEGFVQGSTTADLGTHVQVGAAFTQKF